MTAAQASTDQQMAVLMRGVEYGDANIQRTMERDLRERLKLGRPLRVYQGFDPTFTGLTLGNMVGLLKLRQFQRFGHEVTFLIGTMTARIGDPSDKASARQRLTEAEVEANARDWLEQAFRVLDREKTVIQRNADWLAPLTLEDVVRLASNYTVAEFLAHETFRKRMAEERPLYIHEFIYALMQAYDAYHMKTDVQVGGIDQLFNIMAGRKLQQALGEPPLIAVCTPLLVGTDGVQKMSKSVGNSINMDDAPADIYGKLMSIPDSLMGNYYTLLTEVPLEEIEAVERGDVKPMDAKKRLAHEVVALLHDESAADAAQANFEVTFQSRTPTSTPDSITRDLIPIPEGTVRVAVNFEGKRWVVESLPRLLLKGETAPSVSAARRLIDQGAVEQIGSASPQEGFFIRQHPKPLTTVRATIEDGMIIRVGKAGFIQVVAER